MATGQTSRDRAKADRQHALLRASARLFAERGYDAVSLEDLGSAVGISGPAVYRHFPSKRALLAALLVRTSETLRDEGRAVVARAVPGGALRGLIAFHVDFALDLADIIRVQDRDLDRLDDADRHRVRRLQREYADLWVDVLAEHLGVSPGADVSVRVHAGFGLINSTPHSVRGLRGAPPDAAVRALLADMALSALTCGSPEQHRATGLAQDARDV